MSVQSKWMRSEMLGSPRPSERKLTEAELRVQRSLQKLSIPDWYLNKRTDPPKILTNVTPIESRPSSWKNGTYKKKSTESNSIQSSTGKYNVVKNENEAPNKQNQVPSTHKCSKKGKTEADNRKSSSPQDQLFNLNLPNIKFAANISKTFPKVSPSRKIQNINMVFPQKKKTFGSPDSAKKQTDSKYSKRSCSSPKPRETDSSEEETEIQKSTLTKTTGSRMNVSQDTSFTTSHCLTSTMENIIGESKTCNSTLTEKVGFSSGKHAASVMWNCSEHNARINEDTSSASQQSISYYATPTKNCSDTETNSFCTEDPLRTPNSKANITIPATSTPRNNTTPILSSTMINDTPIRRRSIFPRILIEELEAKNEELVEEKPKRRQSIVCTRLMKPEVTATKPQPIPRTRKPVDPTEDLRSQQSPNTRFFNSRKKSTELENIVQTAKNNGRGMVRGIIQELNRKFEPTPCPAPRKRAMNQETFVKNFVLALENGCKQTAQKLLAAKRGIVQEEDMDSAGSCGESAVSSTTISIKDSDSDSDQISPGPTVEKGEFFHFDQSAQLKDLSGCEDDSVYWIPVPACKLPRTSSLLSMMSRLSGQHHQSPCVSPIRSGDSCKSCCGDTWGSGKVAGNTGRPLFRIDETTVMDSGFSDRSDGSDRSGASSSEFSRSSSLNFSRRSQRRKSIVGERAFEC